MKLHVRFDGPPGPDGPRLIEVEDEHGNSLNAGEWVLDTATGDYFLVIDTTYFNYTGTTP